LNIGSQGYGQFVSILILGEATNTELTQTHDSHNLPALSADASEGGAIAGRTRKDIEARTGKKVSSHRNMIPKRKKNLGELIDGISKKTNQLRQPRKPLDVNPKSHHYSDK
jgi:hypothetical protein